MTTVLKPNLVQIGDATKPAVVFGHGWGRTYNDFIPVAEALSPVASSYLIDFPGFGDSPRPDSAWGTEDYADHIVTYLREAHGLTRFAWVGHSFGGRVGMRIAAAHPGLIEHLVLVASAGIPRTRTLAQQLRGKTRSWEFKFRKSMAKSPEALEALERQYGSADYVHSREIGMRDIFVRTVNEDQTDTLSQISCPTTVIYGGLDFDTPIDVGEKIVAGIPDATLTVCPHYDHISILDRGRHQIALSIKEKFAAP
ncbi:MAG: alpha/beta hydrolase [Pseudomonadota bacterium]